MVTAGARLRSCQEGASVFLHFVVRFEPRQTISPSFSSEEREDRYETWPLSCHVRRKEKKNNILHLPEDQFELKCDIVARLICERSDSNNNRT